MKRFAGTSDPVVVVELVVETVVVAIQPAIVLPDVPDILQNTIHATVPRIISGLYIIWGL